MICPFCQYEHENEGDHYGCPNCNGEGLENMTSDREMRYRKAQAERGEKRVTVWCPVDRVDELKAMAAKMRDESKKKTPAF